MLLVRDVKSVKLMKRVWEAHFDRGVPFPKIGFGLKSNKGMTAWRLCKKYAELTRRKFPVDRARGRRAR